MSDLEQAIAMLNIERYRRLLAMEADAAKRLLLQALLTEEEAKLSALEKRPPRRDGPKDG